MPSCGPSARSGAGANSLVRRWARPVCVSAGGSSSVGSACWALRPRAEVLRGAVGVRAGLGEEDCDRDLGGEVLERRAESGRGVPDAVGDEAFPRRGGVGGCGRGEEAVVGAVEAGALRLEVGEEVGEGGVLTVGVADARDGLCERGRVVAGAAELADQLKERGREATRLAHALEVALVARG